MIASNELWKWHAYSKGNKLYIFFLELLFHQTNGKIATSIKYVIWSILLISIMLFI